MQSLILRGHDLTDEDAERLTATPRRQMIQLLHVKTERSWLGRSGKGYFANREDRQLIREALVLTVAKHGLDAAQRLKSQQPWNWPPLAHSRRRCSRLASSSVSNRRR